jgi:TDG/mug DNA glycosylase family protein
MLAIVLLPDRAFALPAISHAMRRCGAHSTNVAGKSVKPAAAGAPGAAHPHSRKNAAVPDGARALGLVSEVPRVRCGVIGRVQDRTHGQETGLTRYEPDILAKDLDVIFCGLNPASSAAAAGHNFSSASNRFWPALHLAGFTATRLRAEDERRLLEYGCGITAVVRRPTRKADEISAEEFRRARPDFESRMQQYAPRSIAFLGKRALSAMTGRPDIAWGEQPTRFAGTMAWVLPNPSGLNRNFTLDALVSAYARLRAALS